MEIGPSCLRPKRREFALAIRLSPLYSRAAVRAGEQKTTTSPADFLVYMSSKTSVFFIMHLSLPPPPENTSERKALYVGGHYRLVIA